jgi:peroxiredoxin family protein
MEMEHAYAPPFLSAKDPVNVLGFVAENILTGRTTAVHWDQLGEVKDAFLLDIRTPDEFGIGTLPGAVKKNLLGAMFGMMMPCSLNRLAPWKLHMAGMGSWMMKGRQKSLRIDSLQEMLDSAIRSGVRLVACNMSMDVMGVRLEVLVDGVESGGVATMLKAAD